MLRDRNLKYSDTLLKESSTQNQSLCYWNGLLFCVYALCYGMSLINTFIIAMYGVMNYYTLHMPNYSRPSVIRTLMAHLPRLFQTRS